MSGRAIYTVTAVDLSVGNCLGCPNWMGRPTLWEFLSLGPGGSGVESAWAQVSICTFTVSLPLTVGVSGCFMFLPWFPWSDGNCQQKNTFLPRVFPQGKNRWNEQSSVLFSFFFSPGRRGMYPSWPPDPIPCLPVFSAGIKACAIMFVLDGIEEHTS